MKFEEGGNASSSVNTDVAVTELNPEVAPVSSEDSKAPAEEVHEQSNMDVLLDEAQNLSMDQSALDQSVVMEPEVGEADISMAVDDAADDNEDQTGKASGEMEGELDPSSLDVKMEQQVKSEVEIISTKDKFAAIINAAEEEVDETKLYYSTLEGVVDLEKPSILKAELHDHQVTGISWMVHMFKNGMPMILGDQMGLGKTLQTIGFLAYLQATMNKKGPHLIVVPLSVLSNWISEIERFCPSFRAVRFHGPKQERERIKMEEMNDLSEFDIVVTTFEILVSEINFFRRKYVWTSVIIDEGHRLKNEKSQLSEKLRCVPCLGKIILTGTPLQNNLHELWALLYYLVPDIFTSSEPFDSGFDLVRGIIDNNVLRKARKMLSVFMLRRVKEQVNIKLPSKREITVLVSLTDQQIELYKQLLCGLDSSTIEIVMREGRDLPSSSSANALTNGNGDNASTAVVPLQRSTSSIPRDESTDSEWRRLMNILLQLRKICNHTYLLPHIAPEPYEVTEEIVTGSGKLLMLDRMLPKLKVDGHRVLIFSQFTSMLDILEDYCELRDYSFVRLDGETNRVKRRLDVRRFNSPNSNLFIFLISTRAGGLGLNLASADTVILYDSDWNPQVDLQAMERVHRIGQTKPVRIYRLVCRGSVEERMLSRAEKKLFLNAMVAEIDPDEELNEHDKPADPSEVMEALGIGGSAMSKSELASLIRFGANAVVDSETSGNKNISEEELDNLLERQGRDKVVEIITAEAVKNTDDSAVFEQAQAQLKERMESLKEVDLRQLGNMVYNKKKPDKKKSFGGEVLELNEKRQRKERIVMIDGKGTGYGGAVPVLASQLIEDDHNEEEVPENSYRPRGRKWEHRHFCTLCGKNDPTISNVVRCAHCPLVFHQTCGDAINIFPKGFGMFICPHHRCSDCNRSTSSAGGLLFRCAGCLTAFCEDCLPQDEIDSMGRCKPLETYGYHSKQAYYIKCPSCCNIEGFKPMGVLGDRDEREKQEADKKTAEPDQNDDGLTAEEQAEEKAALEEERKAAEEEAKAAMERTQAIRIVWEEVLPPPPPPPTPPKAKKTPKKRKNDEAAEVDGETNEEEATKPTPTPKKRKVEEAVESPPPPSFTHPKVPNGCTLNKGLTLIGTHLCLKELIVFSEKYLNGQSIDFDLEVASIVSKIDSGRYRSIQLFLNDVKYIIEMKVIKKLLVAVTSPDDKMSVNLQGKGLMQFLKDKLEPKLEL